MTDKKILVVDFDEESLIALSNLVFEEGFQAVTAMDGLSGYEKFKAEDFDLVFIEPMLPKLHGFELMKKINQDPVKKIPIIVVTGIYREPSCKMEALQVYGAAAFFTKPWDKDELRSKMLNLLVNGLEGKAAEPKPPAVEPDIPPPPPAKSAAPSVASDWGHLKPQPPARQEHKVSLGLDEIEKELQAVVSSVAGPVRKKEPAKEAAKEKKEAKTGVDGDIEALLKGAIGGLGLDEKKKKPEPAIKPIPIFKPEPRPEKKEKISIAKEIKERIPLQDKTGNNIPPPSARAPIHAPKEPFGIDQTLIEIDKIPLEVEKAVPEPVRTSPEPVRIAPEPDKAPAEKKKVFFDEYVEPERKKPPLGLIGGVAAAALIVAGSTFLVLKSKKPKEAAPQMVSSLSPSLPSEFSLRQEEVQNSVSAKPNEPKPDPKRSAARETEQTDLSEIVNGIQPALPTESQPVGLELQLAPGSGKKDSSEEPVSISTEEIAAPTTTQAPVPQQPEAAPSENAAQGAVRPGDLVAIDKVSIPPTLIKRVDPKYPVQAFNMGISGTVTVNALISETGDVLRTEILKGIKGGYGFEKSAETAVRQWKFRPAEKDGIPIRVWKPIDINFKLSETPN